MSRYKEGGEEIERRECRILEGKKRERERERERERQSQMAPLSQMKWEMKVGERMGVCVCVFCPGMDRGYSSIILIRPFNFLLCLCKEEEDNGG